MISAFDVYLVMQLDSIVSTATIFAIIAGLASVLNLVIGVIASIDEEDFAPRLLRSGKLCLSACLVFAAVATLTPSTKTMAAMIVLPALTSDEVVQPVKKEAAELYDLAKQALRQAVEDKSKKDAE